MYTPGLAMRFPTRKSNVYARSGFLDSYGNWGYVSGVCRQLVWRRFEGRSCGSGVWMEICFCSARLGPGDEEGGAGGLGIEGVRKGGSRLEGGDIAGLLATIRKKGVQDR